MPIYRRSFVRSLLAGLVGTSVGSQVAGPPDRARLRELGVRIGSLPAGEYNAITDVAGVRVGHATLVEGSGPLVVGEGPVRTGVTVIIPPEVYTRGVPAACFTLNGNGEMTGVARIRATGQLHTPVYLTGTANVGIVYDAAITHWLRQGLPHGRTPIPVVAECWDALGDVEGRHLAEADVLEALYTALGGAVEEGSVGGGTGMRSFGFKAGIGTASRSAGEFTVGVLLNANHSTRQLLRVDGVPVGRVLEHYPEGSEERSKSIVMVAATDAPLWPRQLRRLCKRMSLGLARTGAVSTHGSGDLCLAFSTARDADEVTDRRAGPLWQAAVEATEEAAINALTTAETMDGAHGAVRHGLPLDRLVELMRKYHRL